MRHHVQNRQCLDTCRLPSSPDTQYQSSQAGCCSSNQKPQRSAIHQAPRGHLCRIHWTDGLTLASRSTVDAVALNEAHEDNLGEDDGDDGLGVDEAGVAQVV